MWYHALKWRPGKQFINMMFKQFIEINNNYIFSVFFLHMPKRFVMYVFFIRLEIEEDIKWSNLTYFYLLRVWNPLKTNISISQVKKDASEKFCPHKKRTSPIHGSSRAECSGIGQNCETPGELWAEAFFMFFDSEDQVYLFMGTVIGRIRTESHPISVSIWPRHGHSRGHSSNWWNFRSGELPARHFGRRRNDTLTWDVC